MTNHDTGSTRWISIVEHLAAEVGRDVPTERLRNWALVLSSRGIPFRLVPEKFPEEILVPESHLVPACDEILAFRNENSEQKKSEPPRLKMFDNALTTASVLILVGIFHNLTWLHINGIGPAYADWIALGSAESGKILSGEWWRPFTALTLHAGWPHLLGNLLIGGYFVVKLCQLTGSGLGWTLVLTAGALGNLVNAVVHGPGHNAVGMSTAIFGAIGVAGALGSTLPPRVSWRNWLLPFFAATMLLAFLGVGGDNTDIGAHLFGFLCGAALGAPAGIALRGGGQPSRPVDLALSFFWGGAIAAAWVAALASGGYF